MKISRGGFLQPSGLCIERFFRALMRITDDAVKVTKSLVGDNAFQQDIYDSYMFCWNSRRTMT